METSESIAQSRRPIPLTLVLLAVLMVHLPLLLMKLPLKSYDTNRIYSLRRTIFITGSIHGTSNGMRAFPRRHILRCPSNGSL